MVWKWVMVESALRDMKKLPRDLQERVAKKLDFWVGSGIPLNFADTLTDYDLGSYRFRVGHYRVIFDVEEETIVVLLVRHRKESYRG